MNTESDDDNPPAATPASDVQLLCTVLISGTQVGKLRLAKGHRLKLPAEKARALNNLNPPAVSIDGV
ncbi:hypothetical protein OKA04_04705 [Luteolibacter flavescens]|uniref:Uncharacterized protein n=1 Tax=Luteolibacter flavescens TaxID=1859460 RepID=A0ABT3FKN9_9BACT|nr:hypothetical protein [Luteolibacter flavescens]MCW1884017.1 hypothetical protein [Luteolibacter flavescens]